MGKNVEKLQGAFIESLAIEPNSDFSTLAYGKHERWDSIAHMQLVAAIENAFDIMLETKDVIGMSSYPVAMQILQGYGIEFDA